MIEPRLEALARRQSPPPPPVPWGFFAAQVAETQISLVANCLALRLATPSEAVAAAMIAMTRATIDGLAPTGLDSNE